MVIPKRIESFFIHGEISIYSGMYLGKICFLENV